MKARPEYPLRCATVLGVSTGLTHGLPVVLLVLIIVIYLRTAKRPTPYRMSEKWNRPPVLWSAVDEKIPGNGGGSVNVGGGASGGW